MLFQRGAAVPIQLPCGSCGFGRTCCGRRQDLNTTAVYQQYVAGTYDVISPTELLKALITYKPSLRGGLQHDARECLNIFLSSGITGIADRLCGAHGGAVHDGVLLCELGEDARVSGQDAPVDLHTLIVTTLTGDRALTMAPPLLILRIENIYRSSDVVDGDFFVDARIRLPDGNMDLRSCIAGGDAGNAKRHRTTYRLRGYVHHLHDT